ncbi:hypothetical protein GobsT_56020 [Gemmata obscuriglobus]|uniref:Uncharacterized protein n=1 Tax=Gemmata obscuriglobus TaxID=114 RepID=A0A2Z3GS37_9BACT|nr:hypothetical protein C1280_05780 [Gemmata obscuriglobus]QEG30790.1 hypothetical protein GobsT_56020 [Gemmata obscuriglobus]VTS10121.1 unnamed protein product [Gemmata obscuriglobus UQM 2246]
MLIRANGSAKVACAAEFNRLMATAIVMAVQSQGITRGGEKSRRHWGQWHTGSWRVRTCPVSTVSGRSS